MCIHVRQKFRHTVPGIYAGIGLQIGCHPLEPNFSCDINGIDTERRGREGWDWASLFSIREGYFPLSEGHAYGVLSVVNQGGRAHEP